ncbi:uncharacterized protein LOC110847602 [Folsomia candida]|uniref:uncharacterized protein LOC110847602 n=1 Tax=Folsomia candida TaxID=158441 RepID=UPI00160544D8|nr:uncharacterized protein LOC110847602 [Folsomia candida]
MNNVQAISGFNLCIDVAACIDLQKQVDNYDANGLTISAICGIILVLNHMVICSVHLYYASKLLNVIDEKSFLKVHQWFLKLLQFMCVECVVVFLFLFFSNNVLYFIIFGNMSVTFKLYMLWPIKRFMKHLRDKSYIPPGTLWNNGF